MSAPNARRQLADQDTSLYILSLALVQRFVPNNVDKQKNIHKSILRLLQSKHSPEPLHQVHVLIELMKRSGL